MQPHSIAETRSRLSQLIKQAESDVIPVPVTRRGKVVAYIVPAEAYERLTRPKGDFYATLMAFRAENKDVLLDDDEDIFANVRSQDPGREVDLF